MHRGIGIIYNYYDFIYFMTLYILHDCECLMIIKEKHEGIFASIKKYDFIAFMKELTKILCSF